MRRIRALPILLAMTALLWAASGPALAGGVPSPKIRVTVEPAKPGPGDVVLVQVTGAPADVRAEWDGRPLRLFPARGGLAALVGIDLEARPGSIAWRLTRPSDAVVLAKGAVSVRPRTFATQHLALPPGQVDLDPATVARVQDERAELRAAMADSAAERLWRGAFRVPVEGGRPTGGFGLRRIINGQPRSPHAGYDWAAPTGTPVLATNAGRVVFVGEHFFAGRLVVLDHGLSLFTLYFHLDQTRVAAGERVGTGQTIGAVGATGRVTGPHLHFAVSLGGARVDPEGLLALKPPTEPPGPN